LRGDFGKAENNYKEMLGLYDAEMTDVHKEKDKAETEKDDTHNDLLQITEDHK